MSNNNDFNAISTQSIANDNVSSQTNLPVSLDPQRAKPSLERNKTTADFLSQLIAERTRLAAQRPKRRAPLSLATKAYNSVRRIAIKRLPSGFTYNSQI